jgi:hypothetical protein
MVLSAAVSSADTHPAASTSYIDVSAAVSVASPGDIVTIPSGTSTWSSTLAITKGIVLLGAGQGTTVITSGVNDTTKYLITYEPTTPANDDPFRISGLTLICGTVAAPRTRGILIRNYTASLITKVRIDHLTVKNAVWGYQINGLVYGLCDNCTFIDCSAVVYFLGNNWVQWDSQPVRLGTANAFYMEDCSFDYANFPGGFGFIASGHGTQWVMRYCTLKNYMAAQSQMIDLHGNNGDPVDRIDYYSYLRGVINAEIYNNNLSGLRNGSSYEVVQQRGGTLLMFDNTVDGPGVTGAYVRLAEEDDANDHIIPAVVLRGGVHYRCKINHTSSALDEPGIGPNWTTYWTVETSNLPTRDLTWGVGRAYFYSSAYDTVKDSYFYNNTCKGSAIAVEYLNAVSDSKYIVNNSQYWLVDPRGRTINGSVYQPYQYPHPLQEQGGGTAPSSPKGLRMKAP